MTFVDFACLLPVEILLPTLVTAPRSTRMHKGLDIKVYTGDTIVSAFDGKVRMVGYEATGYGHYVVIRHRNGLETIYGHLSKSIAQEGEVVKAGQTIGLGGNTGRSFGSHLHFETRIVGVAIDPTLLFDFPNQDVTCNTFTFRYRDCDGGILSRTTIERNREDLAQAVPTGRMILAYVLMALAIFGVQVLRGVQLQLTARIGKAPASFTASMHAVSVSSLALIPSFLVLNLLIFFLSLTRSGGGAFFLTMLMGLVLAFAVFSGEALTYLGLNRLGRFAKSPDYHARGAEHRSGSGVHGRLLRGDSLMELVCTR